MLSHHRAPLMGFRAHDGQAHYLHHRDVPMPARARSDQADYLIIAPLPMDHYDYNAELFCVSMPGHTADGFMRMPSVP